MPRRKAIKDKEYNRKLKDIGFLFQEKRGVPHPHQCTSENESMNKSSGSWT